MSRLSFRTLTAAAVTLVASACGGGGGSSGGCAGNCSTTNPQRLEIADVQDVIAQAVAEAEAQQRPATIAVVDRSGNVLATYQMAGAGTMTVTSDTGAQGGLEGVAIIPPALGAIAKALTAAYLSSEGNAFSTRTASQIVQQHFNPGESGQPGGPLFGVQFSQLPCSDLPSRFGTIRPAAGPQRSPLGLSADPGGLPLYKNGVPVGAVGILADGVYGLDLDVSNRDHDIDELIALAATYRFEAPANRRADQITVNGLSLRFSDATPSDLDSNPAAAPSFASLTASTGALVAVPGYTSDPANPHVSDASIVAGTFFGSPASGIRPATDPDFAALDAFVLVDDSNQSRFPPVGATDAATLGTAALTAAETRQLLKSALMIANRARAQIRQPLNSIARVTISVVDTNGAILGVLRSRDAPVFGADVSLQKARTAAFFSSAHAAGDLMSAPDATYVNGTRSVIGAYVNQLRQFLGRPAALGDGAIAFTDRAGGNLSRPFFPDGVDGNSNGPLSEPSGAWSIFNDGLQLDLVYNALVQHVEYVLGSGPDVTTGVCTGLPATGTGKPRLGNGMQVFPGSVPVYRGTVLVGGLGVSGDGVDQDDMVAFLGLADASAALGGALGNAPTGMRADQLAPEGVHLRYVECPASPFVDSSAQEVCSGQ